MSFFRNVRQAQQLTGRQAQEQRLKVSRVNLLLMIIVTIINVVAVFLGNESYYLFAAFLPYYLVLEGLFLCGKLPAEWYAGFEVFEFYDSSLLTTLTVISAVMIVVFLICWLLAKKYPLVSHTVALVVFAIDTLGMFLISGISLGMILDYLFHAWIIYYLVIGIIAARKLKTMTEDEPITEPTANKTADHVADGTETEAFNSGFDYKVDEPENNEKSE